MLGFPLNIYIFFSNWAAQISFRKTRKYAPIYNKILGEIWKRPGIEVLTHLCPALYDYSAASIFSAGLGSI